MKELLKIETDKKTIKTDKIILYTIVGVIFLYLAGYEAGKFLYYVTH